VLFSANVSAQHTPVWSQYLTNGLALNPAFAGSRDALSLSVSHRHQWVGIDGAPSTQLLTAHTPLKGDRVAIGLQLSQDAIGVSSSLGGMFNAVYRMRTRKGRIQMGLGLGAFQRSSDWDKVVTLEPGDNIFEGQSQVELLPAASAGAYYYDKKNFLSFSAPFIVNGTDNLPADLKLMAIGGRRFNLNRKLKLTPSVMLRLNAQVVYQVDVNAMLAWNDIAEIGASYRTNETLIFMMRARPSQQFALSYSYDLLLSELGRYEGGSHEITLSYDFKFQHSLANPRFF